jgi:nucleotide-binding universal stress UspA family protein
MHTIRHILIATDFEQASMHAESVGAELASVLKARLTLLNVYSMPGSPFGSVGDLIERSVDGLRRAARAISAKHPDAGTAVRCGDPHREILAAVVELGADMVVLGTHGRHGLDRALIGSVAEHVVRDCPVPVLTVHA